MLHHWSLGQVSTHDLTKRSTHLNAICSKCGDVSTHDLTKRSTDGFVGRFLFQFMFQLTTSRRGRRQIVSPHQVAIRFNSRPHEEVDVDVGFVSGALVVSTHDLTKRSTKMEKHDLELNKVSTHDLTKRSTRSSL